MRKPITSARASTIHEHIHEVLDEIETHLRDGRPVYATATLTAQARPAVITITDADTELITRTRGVRIFAHSKGWDLRQPNGQLLPTLTHIDYRLKDQP
ncbi:hypothetical protein GCM10027418_06390 [Mariniluteicoccus endophyticus]